MSDIKTHPYSKAYAEGWDRIWGKPKQDPRRLFGMDVAVDESVPVGTVQFIDLKTGEVVAEIINVGLPEVK